ncbi:MAG TPA: AAA family ATPase [Telmatospirillum sp.]|nr:AAA family ATPase [Telmatospirillum sp.]
MSSEPLHPSPLPVDRLYRRADLKALPFATTADLEPIDGLAGQNRALEAIRFGSRVGRKGFNLFAIGSQEAGIKHAIETMLKASATDKAAPADWVYVNNFAESHKPIAIALPAGRAPGFRKAMQDLIDDLKSALPVAFEGEEYHTRRGAIDEAFQKKQADAFADLRTKAEARDIVVLRTPLGFALAPARDGKVVPPEEFNSWPDEQCRKVQQAIQDLEKDLEHVVRQIPSWQKERRDDLRKLNRDTAQLAVGQSIDEAMAGFADLPRVVAHFEAVRADLVENVGMFVTKSDGDESESTASSGSPFDRYEVNVLVSQDDQACGVPIVEESHPTLSNLTGRIEYLSMQGALVTSFRLIKAGAMHRANGGYLLIDVRSLLTEPFSWVAVKRALRRGEIVIEDVGRFIGLTSTVSLEPDPIPLDVKVILFGDRMLYYLLSAFDPDLGEHFKVLADFEDDVDRSPETEMVLARFVSSIVRANALKPIDRDGVGVIIEHAARFADHADKLTLLVDHIRDLIVEADFWCGDAGRDLISGDDVQRALDERIRRGSRLRDRSQEAILQNVALIDTDGAAVGQINGLSVSELGGVRFGRPTRITCRVRPGSGRVVDIEREVKLGGPIHSKGVLILSGFLVGRFALDVPMSLYASLVFEQSYGGVEGDSASSAELYVLLSALAGVSLRQDIAVTGSVNQLGEIQAIGGVNEKIEGFFDICRARGLTGTQAVAIPKANVQHLMLRRDVAQACAEGRFAIYPLATIDDGIALLSGCPAGQRDAKGHYPADSVNGLVEARLRDFAAVLRRFSAEGEPSAVGSAFEDDAP